MNYQPGISCKNFENSPRDGKLKYVIQTSYPIFADFYRNSNLYDPVLARIGLGK